MRYHNYFPFMPIYQVVILALVQGFTEFLPVSSSAHLALAPWLLGWKDQGLSFDIALHVGTLAAVLIYFFKDWLQILAQGFGLKIGDDPELSRNPKLLWYLAAASLPIGIFGYAFKHAAETVLRDNKYIIGFMLISVAVLMAAAERMSSMRKDLGGVSLVDSLWIGLFQALAIVPGTSRSGITLVAGLSRQLNRAAAARFSFLLSTPAILAAAAKDALDLRKEGGIPHEMQLPMALGMLLSAITGCLVIAFFMRYLRGNSLKFFIYYRIVFGILIIAMAFFRG
jgi:undecaprenyl-diphosphatase